MLNSTARCEVFIVTSMIKEVDTKHPLTIGSYKLTFGASLNLSLIYIEELQIKKENQWEKRNVL